MVVPGDIARSTRLALVSDNEHRDGNPNSEQPARPARRRRPRPERRNRRSLCSPLPPLRENARNQRRLLDAGDHLEPPAAARAALDLDAEYPLEPRRPGHGHVPQRRARGRAGVSAASRAMKSKGSSTMCVVPSRYGVF